MRKTLAILVGLMATLTLSGPAIANPAPHPSGGSFPPAVKLVGPSKLHKAKDGFCPFANTICFYNDSTRLGLIAEREVADAPRNTCFTTGGDSHFVDNTSNYVWNGYHDSTCSGALTRFLPHSTYSNSPNGSPFHSYYRTSSTS